MSGMEQICPNEEIIKQEEDEAKVEEDEAKVEEDEAKVEEDEAKVEENSIAPTSFASIDQGEMKVGEGSTDQPNTGTYYVSEIQEETHVEADSNGELSAVCVQQKQENER
jgi:hypothetical protein